MALTRRTLLLGAASVAAATYAGAASRTEPTFEDFVARIQKETGGRIGVHVLATVSGTRLSFRDGERFAMCSTFKVPLVAAVLTQVDAGKLGLNQAVKIAREDLVPYAPVVEEQLAHGRTSMSVSELCAATIKVSDNAAANLLLEFVGGPEGLTRFLRERGDAETRLDRIEPDLNTNEPDDPRDTTTPRAMVDTMARILTARVLSTDSRARLTEWLVQSRTGARRIRAGMERGWKVGDKTGTGQRGAVNDVAIVWPDSLEPWLIAIYLSGSTLPLERLEAAHARIGSEIVRRLG